MLAVLVIDLLVVQQQQRTSARAQTQLTEYVEPRRVAAREIERNVLYTAILTRSDLLEADGKPRAAMGRGFAATRASLTKLTALPKEPDGERLFAPIPLLVERYLALTDTLVNAGAPYSAEVDRRLTEARETLLANIRLYGELQLQKRRSAIQAVDTARDRVTVSASVSIFFCAGIALLISLVTVRSIRRPTRKLVSVASAMQQGDWAPALAWAE